MKRKGGPFDIAPRRSQRIAKMHSKTAAPSLQAPSESGLRQQDAMDWTYDTDPATQGRPPALVSLPAELRNRIYDYVLTEERNIRITPQLRVPALLHTSRQVRAETRYTWFTVNQFRITVIDLDAKLVHAWCQNICPRELTRGPKISVRPSHNWVNLLEWCKKRQAGAGRTWSLAVSSKDPTLTSQTRVAAATALRIARMYRGRQWEDCVKALENHRLAIGAFDSFWMDDDGIMRFYYVFKPAAVEHLRETRLEYDFPSQRLSIGTPE